MSLFEVGRLAVKIAGRDTGKTAIVVDRLDDRHVVIDGQTRRRKCNIKHLEPLLQIIKIRKGAPHDEIKAEFKKIGLETLETKPKPKAIRPKKQRKEKLKEKKEEKKKAEKEKPELPKKDSQESPETSQREEIKSSSFEETIEKEVKKEEKKQTL